ncbi:MAG TPA: avidin/streptavidin family protein [Longimicrobiaceae bacterium]|nr:avidin/streptavidin family protein [Longimicrobiaceae bacterium]
MLKHAIAVLALTFALSAGNVSAQALTVESAWTNQSGSTLYIEDIDSEGKLTGFYINRAQGYRCQNTPYPVTGWVLGNNITFTVKWENTSENCQSLTAWAGYLGRDLRITTRWYLTYQNQITTGTDIFTRTAQTTSPSLVPTTPPTQRE